MEKGHRPVAVPNEYIKRERQARGWTQADLAGFLGTDGYTVNRWERGRSVPSLHFRRKLCEVFGKDASELGLMPAQSNAISAPPPSRFDLPGGLWSVPHPRNTCFTGREKILRMLFAALAPVRSAELVQMYALQGVGGIGKTQVALEYAYQHAGQYSAVFWIESETVENILSSMIRIAEVLRLPEHIEADQQRIVAAVQRWCATHNNWLLIWDNLEDMELLQRFLPPARWGAMLITTRSQILGTLVEGLDLAPMDHDEGLLFVLRRARLFRSDADYRQVQFLATHRPEEHRAAEELLAAMGGLPLALDQAGAYLEETGCSLEDYMQRYRQQKIHLLEYRGPFGVHPHSVATTFRLACARVEQEQFAAADLLRVCSFLYVEAIPEELFLRGATHLGPALQSLATESERLDEMIAILRRFSLLQRHVQTRSLSLHRLLQTVLQETLGEEECAVWLRRVVAALNAVFPEVISSTWKQCERLLPHVLAVAARVPPGEEDQELAMLLRKCADYLRERAHYEQARQVYQRALCIWETFCDGESELASTLTGLALLDYEHGQYKQAEASYLRSISILERTVGPEAFPLMRPLTDLAILYKTLGKYTEAERLYQRARALTERAFGPDHLKVAYPLSNLAEVYLEQGRYEQAEQLCQRSLSIWTQAVGPRHSLIAYPLLTQARIAAEQEQDEQAESFYRQALAIWEQTLAISHPLMVDALNGLASIYLKQKHYSEAEALYQRGLSIYEQAFGRDHPDIVDGLNGLANLYAIQERNEQARQLYQRALAIQEQHLGVQHPRTACLLHDFAIFHQRQGNLPEALSLMSRALQIRINTLGDTHPKTVLTRTHYSRLRSGVEV